MKVWCAPRENKSLLELLWDKGWDLDSECGGRGRCGRCRVQLAGAGRVVLACQFIPEKPVAVKIEEKFTLRSQSGVTSGKKNKKEMIAVADIGTTTLRLAAVDTKQKRRVKTETHLNPQIRFGADILSRITNEKLVRQARLEEVISDFLSKMGIPWSNPVTVVGNTVMIHFIFGKSPAGLGQYPYRSRLPLGRVLEKEQNGLKLYTLPLLGAFIGSDCTAAIVAAGIHRTERLTLLVDAGTNGEVVLGDRDRIVACSTAAGPAFEGATLSCGCLAVPGAITAGKFRGKRWYLKTAKNKLPTGVCGSGVLDVVAEGLRAGLIEPNGKLKAGDRLQIYGKEPNGIYLTQSDIREVQLAKAAIASGIKVLMGEWPGRRIERVVITGRLGGRLNINSAIEIGLLPVVPLRLVSQHPDLALAGAIQAVLQPGVIPSVEEWSARVVEVRLAEHPEFESFFFQSMALARWRC